MRHKQLLHERCAQTFLLAWTVCDALLSTLNEQFDELSDVERRKGQRVRDGCFFLGTQKTVSL